jgi:hypothetical protein
MPADDRAALKPLRTALFGPATNTTPAPTAPPTLVVPTEGRAVGPGVIDAETRLRDYVRRLFDRAYAATQQPLPD